MVSLTYLAQKCEFKVFIFLLDVTEIAQNNTLFVWKTFKLQSWKIKLEKWHKPSRRSEITRFYTGKNSKFTGSFSWDCLCPLIFWCCFWSPYFFSCPFCGRPCKTSIICISCWSRWFISTNPKTVRSSLI